LKLNPAGDWIAVDSLRFFRIFSAMEVKDVQAYFESEEVVEQYARAAARLGLWRSEEKIFSRLFRREDSILELGCGPGRIAIGLYELGYRNVLATDYSRAMVKRAQSLAKLLEYSIPFHLADACELAYEDGVFDGAIFGFNGLMQIPGADRRARALSEIFRVLRPGAWFAFTSHDRERSPHRDFWATETVRWAEGRQAEALDDFGDRAEAMQAGVHFMHVPTVGELSEVLESVGFRIEASVMRSELGEEPVEVLEFSDDCRFWVVQKPKN
jgi:SAM-dependent methyltransferase